ncbi:MAG: hypothetical protein AAFZ18_37160 [Myxococcota bacterium]
MSADEHLSDLILDALRRGRGDVGRGHLESCPRCQARQAELAEADRAFEARFVPAALATETLTAAQKSRSGWPWPVPALAAVASAVALLLWLGPETPEVRRKGSQSLFELYVLEGDQRYPAGDAVDALAHLEVRVRSPGFAQVLWGAADGGWTALFPAPGDAPWSVPVGGASLPREVILDGAPETERIGVVVCTTAMAAREAREVLEGRRRSDCQTDQRELRKR